MAVNRVVEVCSKAWSATPVPPPSQPACCYSEGEGISIIAMRHSSPPLVLLLLLSSPAYGVDAPSAEFLARMAAMCGNAYGGRIVANEPAQPDDAFEGKVLVMHVRTCEPGRVLVPFHVGDDHSRTWVLTLQGDRLRLKHDHRHEDGREDEITQYGGDSTTPGTVTRQEFPVDRFSIDLFNRTDRAVSTVNTWAMEVVPGQTFTYELARPTGRLFRVEFDLTRTVDTPPVPWGHLE